MKNKETMTSIDKDLQYEIDTDIIESLINENTRLHEENTLLEEENRQLKIKIKIFMDMILHINL